MFEVWISDSIQWQCQLLRMLIRTQDCRYLEEALVNIILYICCHVFDVFTRYPTSIEKYLDVKDTDGWHHGLDRLRRGNRYRFYFRHFESEEMLWKKMNSCFAGSYHRGPPASNPETTSTLCKNNTQRSIKVVVMFVAANDSGDHVEEFLLHIIQVR